jgi:uncharacterized membrane protein
MAAAAAAATVSGNGNGNGNGNGSAAWSAYCASLALGLYVYPLTALLALGHGLFLFFARWISVDARDGRLPRRRSESQWPRLRRGS